MSKKEPEVIGRVTIDLYDNNTVIVSNIGPMDLLTVVSLLKNAYELTLQDLAKLLEKDSNGNFYSWYFQIL